MAHWDFKDLTTKASNKVLHDKAFNIAKNLKHDGYQRGLASMVYKFFDEKTAGGAVRNENMSNKELAEELLKPIIRKLKNRKIRSSFTDNIWGADLVNIQLISKFDKGFRFLLYVINVFSKHVWVIPFKDKKRTTITNAFQKNLDKSNHKPDKMWVDEDNRSMKLWQEKNAIEMYSTHNEGTPVVAGRFISRGVVRGWQKGLKPPFKYHPNAAFSLLLSQIKIITLRNLPSKLIIP